MTYLNDVSACHIYVSSYTLTFALPTYTCTQYVRSIFAQHGKNFFHCISAIYGWQRAKQIQHAENYNAGKPPAKRRRVPYWKDIPVNTDESSDTVATSSGADEQCPFFDKSQKITPHAAVHLADQVIMGGTHAFNNTAGPESFHPRCITQAAQRSRAYHDVNLSSQKMLEYQIDKQQKQDIIEHALGAPQVTPQSAIPVSAFPLDSLNLTGAIDVKILSRLADRNRRGLPLQLSDRSHVWNHVLCEGVPVSLLEMVHLVLEHLGLAVNMENSREVLRCDWQLGWHVVARTHEGTAKHYRGGGVTPGTTTNLLRGDWIETTITDTNGGVVTSRLARVICGIRISKMRSLHAPSLSGTAWETDENEHQRTVYYLLVRYAAPHPATRGRRGPQNRPLCPGLLSDTHCLWSWAKRRETFRRGCLRGVAWNRNKHMFGPDSDSQNKRKLGEERAWYDLVQASEIKSHANVQLDPDREQSFLQSVMWC